MPSRSRGVRHPETISRPRSPEAERPFVDSRHRWHARHLVREEHEGGGEVAEYVLGDRCDREVSGVRKVQIIDLQWHDLAAGHPDARAAACCKLAKFGPSP